MAPWPFIITLLLIALTGSCRQRPSDSSRLDAINQSASVYPGIDYIYQRTGTPNNIHVLKIDLTNPDNLVLATRSEDRKSTVSKFAQKYKCKVAVNADFFGYGAYGTIGLAIGGGKRWGDTIDNKIEGFVAFGLKGETHFSPPALVEEAPAWTYSAVGGQPLIVENGTVLPTTDCGPHFCARHPRTGIGLSKDGKMLILAVIDGRSSQSKGVTTKELGQVLANHGAWRALNLDGGGSSAMYVGARGGIVNRPSDGRERVVANHLGVCEGLPEDTAKRAPPVEGLKRGEVAAVMLKKYYGKTLGLSAPTGKVFKDVSDTMPNAAAIEYFFKSGITTGCSETEFCPDTPVTRAQTAVFLLRLKHGRNYKPPAATKTNFDDVPLSHPFADWIAELARRNIAKGCAERKFCPDDIVTAEQLPLFLERLCQASLRSEP